MAYELDQETVLISVDDIVVGRNIQNIRTYMTEASIDELAQSIYEDGLLQPIVVMDCDDPNTGDDIIELVAGYRRLVAIKKILADIDDGWTCDTVGDAPGLIKATQFTGTLEAAELLNGVENIEREEVDDVDIAAWLYRMVEDGGMLQTTLAEKLHKSASWVSGHITLHKRGSSRLKAATRPDFLKSADNPRGGALLSFTAAYSLARNLSAEEQDKRIDKALASHEKLITTEEAERAGDADKSARPGKKDRDIMRAEAQKLAQQDAMRYINARGVDAALRWVDGLLSSDELMEIVKWESNNDRRN